MVALLHPGVFVQEIPSGIRSIEGVPTSTCVFVGETERGPLEPTKIRSAGDYARLFGAHRRQSGSTTVKVTMRYEVDLFFQNGGTAAYILRASNATAANVAGRTPQLKASAPGEWGNHVSAVFADSTSGRFRIVVYYQTPGSTEAAFVEDWDRLSTDAADANYVGNVLQRSLYIRWVEGSAAPTADTFTGDPTALTTLPGGAAFTGGGTDSTVTNTNLTDTILPKLDGIDDAAILVGATEHWLPPDTFTPADIGDYFDTLRTYVDARPKQDLFLVGDAPSFTTATDPTTSLREFADKTGSFTTDGITRSNFASIYWPHLVVADPVGPTLTSTTSVPPSGAVAGIFARTDARRGVWKAPAGVEATLGGIVNLTRETIDSEQDDLNPAGVDVIRSIPGAGVVVWGARTLQPASEWRYVPVRRTAMFLRKSIFNGIQFAVFEPNNTDLWTSLRSTITAFMTTQFRNGAFAGTTAKEAFFVKVDAETTTEADQAAGIVNILVGFAPLRPAEFVVVKLSQKTATA